MKTPIDVLIINNCPSFYKVNLYNEIAKKCKIHVIFLALTNQVVIKESFQQDIKFSYDLLSTRQIGQRNKWKSIFRLYHICKRYDYKKIIYGGYDDLEERVFMFLTPKHKNCIQFESSINESKTSGPKAIIKKIFFNRISIALPSGNLQSAVFKALGFKGQIIETKGVGIFNKQNRLRINKLKSNNDLKYLFVGRLISVKNLEFLIRVFNQTNKPLTIVGTGVLEDTLKKQANPNINFTGFISNDKMGGLYCSHDIFILPSTSEPWGLVIEEAIYFGLPVLISDAVGCMPDMVLKPNTGVVFSPINENSLFEAITILETNIDTYKNNCKVFDFEQRDNSQIDAYLKILTL